MAVVSVLYLLANTAVAMLLRVPLCIECWVAMDKNKIERERRSNDYALMCLQHLTWIAAKMFFVVIYGKTIYLHSGWSQRESDGFIYIFKCSRCQQLWPIYELKSGISNVNWALSEMKKIWNVLLFYYLNFLFFFVVVLLRLLRNAMYVRRRYILRYMAYMMLCVGYLNRNRFSQLDCDHTFWVRCTVT